MTANWDPLIQALATLLTVVIIPWGVWEYRQRTNLQETDQQRKAVMQAMDTAKGLVETAMDQGLLRPSEVKPDNRVIQREAEEALARVPEAAKAQGTTIDAAAKMIVARVDTKPMVGGTAGPRRASP